ncbi:hypothetical protein CRG98_025767 [Punica granatum]|uniref:Uncharacterized protein n=1 Tax=Punica granatum TaxID=22663 RepID=A0A2I0JCA6_PUNGR|nr:hypothetical protein CRG98_025767 [Punica granatum]
MATTLQRSAIFPNEIELTSYLGSTTLHRFIYSDDELEADVQRGMTSFSLVEHRTRKLKTFGKRKNDSSFLGSTIVPPNFDATSRMSTRSLAGK